MRVKRLTTWLVLGVAVVLAYAARRRRGAPHRRAVPAAPPIRPVQPVRPVGTGDVFDEATLVPLSDDVAADRDLPDDDAAQAEGESWLEHLQATSAELGPEPERALDMTDDAEPRGGHHKAETRDTPVADHGAAGPRGL